MQRAIPWILIITLSAALDGLMRIETDFDMPRVMAAEALLFLATAVVLGGLRRRWPSAGGRGRAFQTILVWTFAMAGLRSALVAGGNSYFWSNLAPAILALLAFGLHRRRRRRLLPEVSHD